MFGMLSWKQKPLWADSCHIFLFVQARECSWPLSPGIWWTSGAVQGMCTGRNLHGGHLCPPCTPWYQGLSKPGSGPAPQRPVCVCVPAVPGLSSPAKRVTLSLRPVYVLSSWGEHTGLFGGLLGCAGSSALLLVFKSDRGSSLGTYLSPNVLHIQKINLSDYAKSIFSFWHWFLPTRLSTFDTFHRVLPLLSLLLWNLPSALFAPRCWDMDKKEADAESRFGWLHSYNSPVFWQISLRNLSLLLCNLPLQGWCFPQAQYTPCIPAHWHPYTLVYPRLEEESVIPRTL